MSNYARLKPCRMLGDQELRQFLGKNLMYLPETIFEEDGMFWVEAVNEETDMLAVPLVCLDLSDNQIAELKERKNLPQSF